MRYWDVNMDGSLALLQVIQDTSCTTMVFSSSATVYSLPELVPIDKTAPLRTINPYDKGSRGVAAG